MNKSNPIYWNPNDALFWYQHRLRVPVPKLIEEGDLLDINLAEKAIDSAYDWFKKQKKHVPEIVNEIKAFSWYTSIKDRSNIKIDDYHQKSFKIRLEPIRPWHGCKIFLHKNINNNVRKVITPKIDLYAISLETIDNEDFFNCPLHWYTKDLDGADKLIAFNTVMNYNNFVLK